VSTGTATSENTAAPTAADVLAAVTKQIQDLHASQVAEINSHRAKFDATVEGMKQRKAEAIGAMRFMRAASASPLASVPEFGKLMEVLTRNPAMTPAVLAFATNVQKQLDEATAKILNHST
jgi:hypothetical protein